MPNCYPCLILLLLGTKTDIVLFLSNLMLGKVDRLQKFCSLRNKIFVRILIFLVFFSKSGIQYLWQKEISIFKVQVQIKVVLGKNDYFFHQKFELHWWQMNGFLYWCSFYRKKIGAYISLKLIVWLIPTWIWYDLLAVSHL